MSKSLRDTILCEIDRREALENEEKQQKKRQEEERAKEVIMGSLQDTLKKCLEELKDYDGHKVLDSDLKGFNYIKIIMEQLGFKVESRSAYDERDTLYYLRIPYFVKRKGNKPTEAQRLLYEFEQELKKVRKERKKELLVECKLIKEKMRKGEYNSFLGAKGHRFICVSSEMEIRNDYEKNIVYKFFYNFGISFDGCSESKWKFMVI